MSRSPLSLVTPPVGGGMCAHLERSRSGFIHHYDDDGTAAAVSFSEFAAQARALQQRLIGQGLRRGMRVGIVAANSVDWLRWDLALIESGCVVVSLPDELVLDKGAQLMEIYDLSLLVVSRRSDARQAAEGVRELCWLEDRAGSPLVLRPPRGDRPFGVDGVCALTFSSGASGMPKCLMIHPDGIAWDVQHYMPDYAPSASDRLLVFLPLTHQQQRLLINAAYWHQTPFILVRPDQVLQAMKDFRPTLCLAPPLLYEGIHERFLAAAAQLSSSRQRWLHRARAVLRALPLRLRAPIGRRLFARVHEALGGHMRMMITGMAPIHRQVLDFFNEIGIPLYEAYGLTETGVIASNSPRGNLPGSVGRIVKGCDVAFGEDGEILVRRAHSVAVGELDEQGFAHPFDRQQRIATGDIGQLDESGYLRLLGRKKEIILTSQGLKLHPERVESLLNEHPAVGRSVVFSMGAARLGVVIQTRAEPTAQLHEALEVFAAQTVRRVAAQATVGKTVLTAQPFTPGNGLLTRSLKINRRAVEKRFAPELFARAEPQSREPTPEELASVDPADLALMRRLWEEVLGRKDLPVNTDIFELGGDSLCAMRILTRLREETGCGLTAAHLLGNPTILGVARALSAARRAAASAQAREAEMVEGAI